ncbi:hypothetical protein ACQEVY_23340 [Streptomyces sp. CA-288835]|uniref:hypothetical protein n=1 Tax=Streptomyces sp. CA-288835 TaxID=3240069 RepID=UPI003D926A3A
MPEEFDTTYRGMDMVAIQRYRDGAEPLPELTEKEQRFAAWYLVREGVPTNETARRLGVSAKCVMNWCARREAANHA